jgi:hypothetical protein
VLTARVQTDGTVVEKAGAVYLGRTLPSGTAPGTPGTLASIDEDSVVVDDDGDVFFVGTGSNALSGVWTVDRLGTPILAVAVQGAAVLGGGSFGGAFDGVGTDATGSLALFAVDVNGSEALFATLDGTSFLRVSSDGDGPQGTPGRLIEDVHDGGPLVVRYDGTSGDVTWRAGLTGSTPDRAVLSRQVVAAGGLQLGALATLLAPGATLPATANGLVTDVRLLPCVPGPARWPLESGVAGGSTSRVYYSEIDRTSALTEVWRQGEVAPGGGAWGTVYPSLSLDADSDGYAAASSDGSLAFSAVLADATSGVWWAVVGLDFFLVAKEGAVAPVAGGPVFASFATPSAVTTDDGVVAFRAALTGGTAPTGLFRQN